VANPADSDVIPPLTAVMLILRALDVRVNRTIVSATMHRGVMETPATRVQLARNVVRQATTLDATTTAATVKH
jgi:hypothetical protein